MASLDSDLQTTAQWQKLVKEAAEHVHIQLDEELESYLVFLLMRYTGKPDMAGKVMALEYLRGMQAGGVLRQDQLRDVGDQCLLYCGLFPRRAERRRVKISYYVGLGRSAYYTVAGASQRSMAAMFSQLSMRFVELMDTLQGMRTIHHENNEFLDPLGAAELVAGCGSKRAQALLEKTTCKNPLVLIQPERYRH